MSRIECLIKIEEELNKNGCKLIGFTTREGVIDITYKDNEDGAGKLYIPYRFMTNKLLHNILLSEVM